jgi:hypothetical protein
MSKSGENLGMGISVGRFFSFILLSFFFFSTDPLFFSSRDVQADQILGKKIDEAAIQMVSLKVELDHGLELPLLDSMPGDIHYMGIMCTRF